MYRQSKYNIYAKQFSGGSELVFNTRTAALGNMRKETKEFLDQHNSFNEKELIDCVGNETYLSLKQNGFIIDESLNEIDLIRLKSQHSKLKQIRFS